jgi:hypothetical protein
LVTSERRNDSGLVGEDDLVLGGGWKEALKESDGRVEDDGALNTSLDADLDFIVVYDVRADTLDVGW